MKKLNILYEDKHIVVCHKDAGIAVQTKDIRQMDLENMILNEWANRGEKLEIFVVHRLDQPVEGVIVFAKTKEAAAELSSQFNNRQLTKEYLAVVKGQFEERDINLENYLLRDGRGNFSRIVKEGTKNAKLAALNVMPVAQAGETQLVKILLKTGRHHQIRVQLSGAGHPIIGDKKYNPDYRDKKGFVQTALCAYSLSFVHPFTKKTMEFKVKPRAEAFGEYDSYL